MIYIVIIFGFIILILVRYIVLLRKTIKCKNAAISMLQAKIQYDKGELGRESNRVYK